LSVTGPAASVAFVVAAWLACVVAAGAFVVSVVAAFGVQPESRVAVIAATSNVANNFLFIPYVLLGLPFPFSTLFPLPFSLFLRLHSLCIFLRCSQHSTLFLCKTDKKI